MSGGGGGGMSLKMAVAALGGSGGSISGAVREVAANPTAVIAQREREKRDLQELNDRFASYIERVRFLEADNKRLQSIIDVLKVSFFLEIFINKGKGRNETRRNDNRWKD